MYYPQPIEGFLSRRNVFALNALGLAAIYLAILLRLAAGDITSRNLEHLMVITGGMFAAFVSIMGALGSKRTSDMQNIGLFVWAGLLLAFTMQAYGSI